MRRLCTLLTLMNRQDWVYWLKSGSAVANKWTCGTKTSSQLHSWHLKFQQWRSSSISGSFGNGRKKKHFLIKKMQQERKHDLRDVKKETAHCCQYCDMALYPEWCFKVIIFQVFKAVVDQTVVFFWVFVPCGSWMFRHFGGV